jgi:hypothetical protein
MAIAERAIQRSTGLHLTLFQELDGTQWRSHASGARLQQGVDIGSLESADN